MKDHQNVSQYIKKVFKVPFLNLYWPYYIFLLKCYHLEIQTTVLLFHSLYLQPQEEDKTALKMELQHLSHHRINLTTTHMIPWQRNYWEKAQLESRAE